MFANFTLAQPMLNVAYSAFFWCEHMRDSCHRLAFLEYTFDNHMCACLSICMSTASHGTSSKHHPSTVTATFVCT